MTDSNLRKTRRKSEKPTKKHILGRVVLGFLIFIKDIFIGVGISLFSLLLIGIIFFYIIYLNVIAVRVNSVTASRPMFQSRFTML